MSNKKLKCVDFFCSAGGVTNGFKQAGIDVIGGIDIDGRCKETYERNNNAKFLEADISTIEKGKVGEFFNIKKNQDDLIFVGCSPCQYFSNIKTDKTKSCGTRLLLADFQEFVEFYNPGYIFVENVPGLEKKKDSPLNDFKKFLINQGYVIDDKIVNAKYFGVPQNRRRYVLLASRVEREIHIPEEDRFNIKDVKSVIGDLNKFKKIEAGHKDKTDFQHSVASLSRLNLKRIKNTPKNGGDSRSWPSKLLPDCRKKSNGHYDVYGRMAWEHPSPTITTRFISYSNGRFGHPEQNRAISIREGASLQSFPNDYIFYSNSQGEIARMIGNAVPPELAKRIGKQFLIKAKKGV